MQVVQAVEGHGVVRLDRRGHDVTNRRQVEREQSAKGDALRDRLPRHGRARAWQPIGQPNNRLLARLEVQIDPDGRKHSCSTRP